MIKKLTYLFILIGFMGLFTLIPGSVDKAVYYYFRITGGNTIELSNQCYSVPDGWVVDSVEIINDRKIYNLRTKDKAGFKFASVIHSTNILFTNLENLIPQYVDGDLFKIYELSALSSKNTVRFWSYISKYNLIIMGREINVLQYLSLKMRHFSC